MLSFSCVFPNPENSSTQTQQDLNVPETKSEKLAKIFTKYRRIIMGCYCLGFLYLDKNQTVKDALNEQLQPKNLLKNFAYEYSTHLYATFFHELGHALAAKALGSDSPLNVHIGSNADNPGQKSLFSCAGISIDGLEPSQGITFYDQYFEDTTRVIETFMRLVKDYYETHNLRPDNLSQDEKELIFKKISSSPELAALIHTIKEKNKSKTAIVMLSGGTLSIIAHVFIQSLLNYIKNRKSYAHSVQQALIPDAIICNQLLNMFLPFMTEHGLGSDGGVFWESMGVSPEHITQVSPISPWIYRLSEIALSQRTSSRDVGLPSNIIIGCFNNELRGFLRLKV